MKFSKTNLISIFLIIFIILSGFFAFQWWQVKGELGKQIEENENLAKQVDELQKEIEELKTAQVIENKIIEDKKAEVSITTEKEEYTQGEIIKYTVKNNKGGSIWFPSDFPDTSIITIEKKIKEGWIELGYSSPCLCPGCVREPPDFVETKSKKEYGLSWDQAFCDIAAMENKNASKGVYRIKFLYSNINRITLEESVEIYSNEFIIK